MKKIYLVDENLNEFAGRRGRPKKQKVSDAEDNWYSADDEFETPEAGPDTIEDVELEDEVSDIAVIKQLTKRLKNELIAPEFSRAALKFRVRGSNEMINGIPMAELGGGSAFLFKTGNGLKKVKIEDILVESIKGPIKFVSESFKDYE